MGRKRQASQKVVKGKKVLTKKYRAYLQLPDMPGFGASLTGNLYSKSSTS